MKLTHVFVFIIACSVIPNSSSFTLKIISSVIKYKLFNVIDNSIADTKCANDLKFFISELSEFKLWALKMLDASGKLHPGIMKGNIYQTGNYDECLDVSGLVADGDPIEGQYCSVQMVSENNTRSTFGSLFNLEKMARKLSKKQKKQLPPAMKHRKIIMGLCVPKSCSADLLQRAWDYAQQSFQIPVRAVFQKELCDYKEKPMDVRTVDFYVFLFFACVFCLVVGSTLYDLFLRQTCQKQNVWVCFSLYTNLLSLMSTACENSTLKCLYGLRVISMIWIILAHVVTSKAFAPVINLLDIITDWQQQFENSVFLAAPLAVDTFLTISGLLSTYLQLKLTDRYTISLSTTYIYRILRLSPALVAIILIHITFTKYITDGPFSYNLIDKLSGACTRQWWKTLLYINNFQSFTDQCVLQSWYLSVDTQLYLLSPFIVCSLKKSPKKTLTTICAACIISFIYTLVVVSVNRYGYILFLETDGNYDTDVYYSTLARMPAWLIGVALGYLLYKDKHVSIKLTKSRAFTIQSLALFTMLGLILYHTVLVKNEYNVVQTALFTTFSKPIWALAISAIIFVCSSGHGGIVDDFLSHPAFIVLGKLTYSMFLIHLFIIYVLLGNQRENYHFSNFQNFQDFVGSFVIILISALGLCLVFESPIFVLIKRMKNYAANSEVEGKLPNLVITKGE